MAGISPAVLCQPGGTLGRNTAVQQDQKNRTPVDSLTLASTNTDFAFSLYKELVLNNPDKNIVFSPFSISSSLAVLSLGARSKTLEEILEGLKFNLTETPEADIHRGFGHLFHMFSQSGDQVQVRTGNAMFVENHLKILAEFKKKAKSLYQAEASPADFQQPHEAKKLINNYVRKQTQGKITELISDLDESTLMVLVNYIYFKGKWKMPFDPHNTLESVFQVDNKRTVKMPMMNIEDLTAPYFWDEELSCSVVELKYRGNASALFILPDEGKMQQMEASLQPETLRKWKDSLRPRKITKLSLPKFSISSDYSLEEILPQLGIREVFSTQADLSRITGVKDLRVSKVVHKAVLDMAETGTEAAATTECKMSFHCAKLSQTAVHLNKPFLMIVCDTVTQMTLFLAKISNPSLSTEQSLSGPAFPKKKKESLVGINRHQCSWGEQHTRKASTLNIKTQVSPKQAARVSSAACKTEKMAILVVLGLLMAAICFAVIFQTAGTLGSNTKDQKDRDKETQVDSLTLASTNTDFAFSLYKELVLQNPNKNVVFSPLSISAALAILSLGARNDTLEEILEGLKFNLTETPEADIHRGFGHLLHMLSQSGEQTQIRTGNAVFIEKSLQILAEFKEKARSLYQAEVSPADFQQPHEAKTFINDYVRNQTQGKITELFSDMNNQTLMVLVNYIYFTGKWRMSFKPHFTHESDFYVDQKTTVKVLMMNHRFLITPYFRDEELSCSVVELKYRGNASALFILPDEDRMQQVEASLQPETLRKWKNSLRPSIIKELSLPKFSISADYSLKDILPQLGIREVFTAKADLSRITGDKHLRVSKVVHKTVLDVTESGTEAAAAIGIIKRGKSKKWQPMTVHFHRSFLVIVSDTNTQTALFIAKVTNPKRS